MRAGKTTRMLSAHPKRPRVELKNAPKGRVAVEVRALRMTGGKPVVARLRAGR